MRRTTNGQRLSLIAGGLTLAAAVLLSIFPSACARPDREAEGLRCRDRETFVNKDAKDGVDDPTIVICRGHRMRWKHRGEDWSIHFDVSPFLSGVKDIKKGDPDPGPVIGVDKDTIFKYTITINGVAHDPQIIIIGR